MGVIVCFVYNTINRVMEQVREVVLFRLILIILCCSLSVVRAIDCGGTQITRTILVDQSGKGQFRRVQAAIDSIMQNNDRWVKVHINPGTYIELVEIPLDKPCVILEGNDATITFNSLINATFSSFPPNVVVTGITFENSYNLRGPPPNITQAMAAAIRGDKNVALNCSFLGAQDTLYDAMGRHYFKGCYIQGKIDFIFGAAQSFYESCIINATDGSYITAQSRGSADEGSGFVFKKGFVLGNAKGRVYLGRAWGPYSTVVFHGTYFGSLINPRGWKAWHFKGQEEKFTYAEIDCRGPGSDTRHRVPWEKNLNRSEIKKYSLFNFINRDGWLGELPIQLA